MSRATDDGVSADGQPEPSRTAEDREFGLTLDTLDALLNRYYQALCAAAETIDTTQMSALDPDWLIDLGRRQALDKIRARLMAAQHELHGATLDVLLARREATPYRPPWRNRGSS